MNVSGYAAGICERLEEIFLSIDEAQFSRIVEEIDEAPRVFVLGRGRSGAVMRMFAMRLMHLGMVVHVVGDTTAPSIAEEDLLMVGSGSGQTPSCGLLAGIARQIGASVGLITGASGSSPLAELADFKIVIPVGTNVADEGYPQQFGGSFFEQALLICLDAVVDELRRKRGISFEFMKTKHANLE